MKLRHLEVFHAVMLAGTLSSAARLLHMTQPAATQSLQAAERQLGYALFTRQNNRLVPTTEALVLMPEVSRLMGQLDAVRRLALAQREGAHAPLRVLLVPSLAVVQLPAALRLFRQRHAAVALQLRSLHSAEIVRALALREADLGIVYGPPNPATGLDTQVLAQGRLVCVSRRPLARGGAVTLAEVAREPWIRIDERDPLGGLLAEHVARAGVQPEGGLAVQTHHTALVLAEQGFGVAVIDSFTAAARQDRALHVQPLEPEVPVTVHALLPAGPRPQRAAAAFVRAFAQALQAG